MFSGFSRLSFDFGNFLNTRIKGIPEMNEIFSMKLYFFIERVEMGNPTKRKGLIELALSCGTHLH